MLEETTIIKSKAIFSDDKEHRLLLRKEWDSEKNTQDAQRGHQHAGLSFIDLHALHHVCQNRLEPVLTEAGRQI